MFKLTKTKISLFLVILMELIINVSYATGTGGSTGKVFLGAFKLVIYIFLFIIVIAITIIGTRYIAKNFTGVSKTRFIKSIDRIALSNNFNIYIIEIFGKIYIIANNDNDIKVIDQLDRDSVDLNVFKECKNVEAEFDNESIINEIKKFLSKEDKYEK